MLLETIILILRETLEAGALLSLLISINSQHQSSVFWVWKSIAFGIIGAIFYASIYRHVNEWFDYTGQEIVNAGLQASIYACLIIICVWLILFSPKYFNRIKNIMGITIALAICREGSEIIIFYSGFLQNEGVLIKALTSGFIGLTIGISFGVICYFLVSSWSSTVTKYLQLTLLTFIAAGLTIQASQLLMQIDWIPSGRQVWDSSQFLSEHSIIGQLIYAVFGYEATPTFLQIVLYALSLVAVFSVFLIKKFSQSNSVVS